MGKQCNNFIDELIEHIKPNLLKIGYHDDQLNQLHPIILNTIHSIIDVNKDDDIGNQELIKLKIIDYIFNGLSEESKFSHFTNVIRNMNLDSSMESNIITLVALKDI